MRHRYHWVLRQSAVYSPFWRDQGMDAERAPEDDRIELGRDPNLRSQIREALKGTKYFSMVSGEVLDHVLTESRLVRLSPGDKLIEEGSDDTGTFYFLLSGSIGVHAGGKYIRSINDVGDAVGEISVITQAPRSADVIAELDAELVEVPWDVIKRLQDRDPTRTIPFLEMMTVFLAEKLQTTTRRVHLYEGFVVEMMEGQRKKDDLTADLRAKYEELEKSNEKLKNLAIRDLMTNLLNHAEFEDNLERQITLFRRNPEPFSLVMGDLDDFKRDNDTNGHVIGDRVIRNAAKLFIKSLRDEVDSIYRYGGEEFAVIMRNTSEPAGAMVMERYRIKLERMIVPVSGIELRTTMSLGIGEYRPEWKAEDFVAQVDAALYIAKRAGKNRVAAVGEVPSTDRAESRQR